MSAIILKEIKTLKYYLGYKDHLYLQNVSISLDVDDESLDEGRIKTKDVHKECVKITKTDKFTREFKVGEYLHIDNENLLIEKVSHDPDGNILYYINKVEYIDDEESKKLAEENLLKRKEILLQRREDELKKYEYKTIIIEPKPYSYTTSHEDFIKKWYQFWK